MVEWVCNCNLCFGIYVFGYLCICTWAFGTGLRSIWWSRGCGKGKEEGKEDLVVQSRDICAIHLQSSLSRWFDKDRERAVCLPKLSLSLVSSPFPPYLFSLQVMGLVFARTECCLRDSTPISGPNLSNSDETKADMIVTTWIMDMIHITQHSPMSESFLLIIILLLVKMVLKAIILPLENLSALPNARFWEEVMF